MSRALAASIAFAALACGGMTPAPPRPAVPRLDHVAGTLEIADDERAIWARADEADRELLEAKRLVADETLLAYLRGVLTALEPALPASAPPRRLYVLREPARQAGTTAHGTIVVSVGMLAALENEAQLAGLLGHELGHYLARHRLVEKRYEAISTSTVERAQLARANEDEADRIGLERMRVAGYDPRELARMLALVRQEDAALRSPHPAWETHPFIDARIRRISEQIPANETGRKEAERFRGAVADLLAIAARLELEAGRLPRARALVDRYQGARPDSALGFFLKGELLRVSEADGRRAPGVREAYERAFALDPMQPDVLRSLGFLFRDLGDTERARALLARYVEVAPEAVDRKLVERWIAESAEGR